MRSLVAGAMCDVRMKNESGTKMLVNNIPELFFRQISMLHKTPGHCCKTLDKNKHHLPTNVESSFKS